MSGQKIPIESRASLDRLVEESGRGQKLVMTKYGVVNLSSIDSIVVDVDAMRRIAEQRRMGIAEAQARSDVLGPDVISEDMKKLPKPNNEKS